MKITQTQRVTQSQRVTQTESGKAWEYGLARQCADMFNQHCVMPVNSARTKCQNSYDLLSPSERGRIDKAANEAVLFLRTHDPRTLNAKSIVIQSDMRGAKGDVRDLLIETNSETIGISAKHRHTALKHSRLSEKIDFGNEWYGIPCTSGYWDAVNPIFEELRARQKHRELFRNIPNLHEDVYIPILNAFIDEVINNANPEKMMRYLLGRYDFYKVIKENGDISIQSFNMGGSLKWGSRIPLPGHIVDFSMKLKSKTTAIMNLDRGWQVSFRIHNANKHVEPSLKFDVTLIGSPQQLSRHEIPYG